MLSIDPFGHFNQMIPELGFDRAVDLADLLGENDLVELRDHLAAGKFPEFAAAFSRRALGMGFRDLGEIFSAFDL